MSITVQVDGLFGGYAAQSAKEGEEVKLQGREFFSSEDSAVFESRVGGILGYLFSKLTPDQEKELLPVAEAVAILKKDSTAILYLNTIPGDINTIGHVRSKRGFAAGEDVLLDDIADMERMEFKGIKFPPDAGIAVIFRAGGRSGYFFDMMPLHGQKEPREFDVEKSLGFYFCYLSQQHLFEMEDADWDYLFDGQWFPFITLKVDTRRQLVEKAKSRLPLDDLLPNIVEEIKNHSEQIRARIKTHSIFSAHSDILEHALNKYLEGDYMSATALLYPRIEGVMRSVHRASGATTNATQSTLVTATVRAREDVENSSFLLLPSDFLEYLNKVYFASFDPNSPAVLSRNSVGHGVAQQEDYDLKSSTIGLLIVDQISFFLPDENVSS